MSEQIDKTIERVTRNRSPVYLNCKDFRDDIEAIISDRERLKAELQKLKIENQKRMDLQREASGACIGLRADLSKAQEKIKELELELLEVGVISCKALATKCPQCSEIWRRVIKATEYIKE